jgi:hypothetical protein
VEESIARQCLAAKYRFGKEFFLDPIYLKAVIIHSANGGKF